MDPHALIRLLDGWHDLPGPLYERLAAAVERLIERGELPPGTRLPAERRLAAAANVSRGTVVNAYQLLRQRALVRARQGSGTVVSGTPAPLREAGEPALNALLAVHVSPRAGSSDVIDLQAAAWHDAHDLPDDAFDVRPADLRELRSTHGYFPAGVPVLRSAIARYLTDRGLPTEPDQVLVTCGGHQAIMLVTRMAVTPGDVAVTEELTYPGAGDALHASGAKVVTTPVTSTGVDVDALDRVVRDARPSLVYLIPTVHNPTGGVLSADARERLVPRIGDWESVVVDDESLVETLFEGDAPPPLAAFASGAGPASRIFTIGSASKTFWGGLRVGWVRGPRQAIAMLTRLKTLADLSSPVVSQLVTARLFERAGELLPARRALLARRVDAITSALAERLPDWSVRRPSGGLAVWARLPGMDGMRFADEALRHGVGIVPGVSCSPHGGFRDHVRIGVGTSPERLEEAVRRLSTAWDALHGNAPASSVEVIV